VLDSLRRGRRSGGQASGALLCWECGTELSACYFAVGGVADVNGCDLDDGGEAEAEAVMNAVVPDIGRLHDVVGMSDGRAGKNPKFGNVEFVLKGLLAGETKIKMTNPLTSFPGACSSLISNGAEGHVLRRDPSECFVTCALGVVASHVGSYVVVDLGASPGSSCRCQGPRNDTTYLELAHSVLVCSAARPRIRFGAHIRTGTDEVPTSHGAASAESLSP
jgi:hypothetical protein